MLVKDQWIIFLEQITNRKRSPAKGATRSAYMSYFQNHIKPELGNLEVGKIENGVMKKFVAKLAEKNLSAASISAIVNCLKGIVASDMDENGNRRHNPSWNTDFIDAPPVTDQNAPIISREALESAITALPEPYRTLIIALGGSGLRIGEMLAIRADKTENGSYWDREESKFVIRRGMWRGREQSTKTPAGVREIDLCNELNDHLINRFGDKKEGFLFPVRLSTAYNKIREVGVPGFHSLRRYRVTNLENQQVPRTLVQFWIGHSGKEITDRYCRLDSDKLIRKEWAFKAGLNFTIPKANRSEDPTQTSKPLDEPKARGRSEEVSC